jgi:hypothetical protein
MNAGKTPPQMPDRPGDPLRWFREQVATRSAACTCYARIGRLSRHSALPGRHPGLDALEVRASQDAYRPLQYARRRVKSGPAGGGGASA